MCFRWPARCHPTLEPIDVNPAPTDLLRPALVSHSPRLSAPPTPWISTAIHAAVLIAWAALFTMAFRRTGLSAWSVGGAYVAYDTLLLLFVGWQTWALLKPRPAAAEEAEVSERVAMTIVVAAYNEAAVLPATLSALFDQSDPADDIVVVDDGSTDGTADVMREHYRLEAADLGVMSPASPVQPSLRWLRLARGGKARALNAAILQVHSPVVLTIDADTLLDVHALAAVRRAFAREPELTGTTGVIVPVCASTVSGRIFQWFQTYEYIRNFLSRYAWMRLDSLLLISGAFAGFRRDALVAVGGFDPDCLVEDYELIHRMRRYARQQGLVWRFRVLGDALARTEAPGSIPAFLRQRRRWFGGFLQTQYWYRSMVGDARLGWLGVAMLPVKAIDTLQPLYGLTAFLLLVFYIVTGRLATLLPVAALIATKIVIDLCFHLWSVRLYRRWIGDGARASPGLALLAALVEPFSFQLLRHWGAALGWVSFLTGQREWGAQRRFGLDKADRGSTTPS